MTIGGYDVGRAAAAREFEIRRKQNVFVGGDGTTRVRDRGPKLMLMAISLPRLTILQYYNLMLTVLDTAAEGQKNTFVIVDDFGVSRTCRLWENLVRARERIGRIYEVDLVVRIESGSV